MEASVLLLQGAETSVPACCVGDDDIWGLRLDKASIAIVDQICQLSLLGNGPFWALPEDHGLFSTFTSKVGPQTTGKCSRC